MTKKEVRLTTETWQPTTIFPWHHFVWQTVLTAWQQNRLPHALLLGGPPGMGKLSFARHLVSLLLCEKFFLSIATKTNAGEMAPQPCGVCKGCHLLQSGNHPDFFMVQPAEAGKQITIDQIRELIQFCALTSHYGRYQIVIIQPAEAMNRNSANSLLKLLEEPPPKNLLFLVSHQPGVLLPTIRSRCQRLDFNRPDSVVTQRWLQPQLPPPLEAKWLLKLTTNAPLAALALVKTQGLSKRQELFDNLAQLATGKANPINVAETWSNWEVPPVLQWMLSWTMDLIRYALSSKEQFLVNQDRREVLSQLARHIDCRQLFKLLELQQETYRLISGGTNVNSRGLLEVIAIAWFELNIQSPIRIKN